MTLLPVCSATSSCSSNSLISFHGVVQSFSAFRKEFECRCNVEDGIDLGLAHGIHLRRISFKTRATKSLYPVQLIDELHPVGSGGLKYVDSSSVPAVEQGLRDFTDQMTENADNLMGPVGPETIQSIELRSETISDSLDVENNSISSIKSSFDDFFAETNKTFSSSISKLENAWNNSLDTITNSVTSVTKSASEKVDNAGESAGNNLTGFSTGLKEASSKATVVAIDALRSAVVALEDSITKGASFVVYSYGTTKELLPPEIRDALNLSEERAIGILRPLGSAFQQVSITFEGFERSLGLDPGDPVVPFSLFLGSSATLWAFYWVWTYGGYSGDLSPKTTLELLTGKENAVLIDVRPEVMREQDGIPDLRRGARFRYASVYLPEVGPHMRDYFEFGGPVRKLLRSGRELDDTLTAAVISNLKIVKDRSKVIVLDADGSRSKGIARSLRKLGIKRPYVVQGGFQSWVKEGLRIKELKPETALTILNEDAEAILEEIKPSPVQVLGFGVGLVAAFFAVIEWEKTLQIIGLLGLGQTIYRRVASYETSEDFRQDIRRLLAPVRLGALAYSWAAGKLETNGNGLPTLPSSADVQNRVLQAAAKHESQPSDAEGTQDPSPESVAPINEQVDLSEA